MLKKLASFLNISKLFNYKEKNLETEIPDNIEGNEKIIRAIYSPINLHKKGKRINNSFYKPRAGEDEISVNRLDYTTPFFLKNLAKTFENKENRRNYFGFSVLKSQEINDAGLNIVYSPIENPRNPFHADIKLGYTVEKNIQLPSEISYKIKKITDQSRLYEDPNPDSKEWNGDILI